MTQTDAHLIVLYWSHLAFLINVKNSTLVLVDVSRPLISARSPIIKDTGRMNNAFDFTSVGKIATHLFLCEQKIKAVRPFSSRFKSISGRYVLMFVAESWSLVCFDFVNNIITSTLFLMSHQNQFSTDIPKRLHMKENDLKWYRNSSCLVTQNWLLHIYLPGI